MATKKSKNKDKKEKETKKSTKKTKNSKGTSKRSAKKSTKKTGQKKASASKTGTGKKVERKSSSGKSASKKSTAKKSASGKSAAKKSTSGKSSPSRKQEPAKAAAKSEVTSGSSVSKRGKGTPKHAAKKKRSKGAKVLALLSMVIIYSSLFIMGAFAVNRFIVKPDTFPKGSMVNGVDVSGLDIDGAKEKLGKSWNEHTLSIRDESGAEIAEIKDLDFEYDIDDSLESVLRPGAVTAITRFVKGQGSSDVITMDPVKSTKKFDEQFNDLDIVKNSRGTKKSKNAYIDKSDTEFRIVKEVYGDSIDTKRLKKAMMNSIADGKSEFDYKRSSFFKAPKITSTSKELKDELEYCKKYLTFKIEYRNPVNEYTVTPGELDRMMKVKKGKVKLRKEEINSFVTDTIYPKFSTTGATRRRRSAGGGRYTVTGGTYGYTIDIEKESRKLGRDLKDRVNVEREPVYAGKAPKAGAKDDIGDDYVEISIGKQMVWVVRNGKVKVKSAVVTGNTTDGHATPTGTYSIAYKQTNTTLRGRNNDGSEYESHVNYWAPFYLGYGLHDANWRGVFGGNIYQGGGSHGCVNCPPAVMPKIFDSIYTGMPVIVHS